MIRQTPKPRPSAKTRDIRLGVVVKASPMKIYRALTSARTLCRWWLEGAETDAKNGGRLRLVWPGIKMRDGKMRRLFPPHVAWGEARGVFADLDPGRKICWIWTLPEREPCPPLSSFFIEPRGNSSAVTLVHAGFSKRAADQKIFLGARLGWGDCLAKLKLYLEKGKTLKTQILSLDGPNP